MTETASGREGLKKQAAAAWMFGREWVREPRKVGAIVPSSQALARAITEGIGPQDGPVIELGPGTGVFTAALLQRGLPADQIAAIEANPTFADALRLRFPGVAIIHGSATRTHSLTPFAAQSVGTIICGLPLLSIPPQITFRILHSSFVALKPGGTVRLFTYGHKCPAPQNMLKRLGLTSRRLQFIPMNVPPASVFVVERGSDRR
ncbi:class I SAM-dependent methyltransferase [Cognatishimia sp. F0-27]|uniref:class I SAM-dependent methyltransferase n=1 Tax=Cognatishimia sp. F0-27 TaxID=2816855 RepID=UPI001D0C8BC2|nr:methyltransferase domain-containing protein [Cognatishimia sp. F0-27]MCC1494028.1 methyltransferase domain-containing protein [Cognatishimia sp. F0-27]